MGTKRNYTDRHDWTLGEIEALQLYYPTLTWAELLDALPGRRKTSIRGKAVLLGLHRPKAAKTVPQRAQRPPKQTAEERRAVQRAYMAKQRKERPEWILANRLKWKAKNPKSKKKTAVKSGLAQDFVPNGGYRTIFSGLGART